ncbi:MAG: IS4 family transposase [Clostridiaceae bacterium]
MQASTKLMSKMIKELFNEKEINTIAEDIGFKKRNGKITPVDFLSLCVFSSDEICTTALSKMCANLQKETGIIISAQGLNDKFNPCATAFLKSFLERLIKKQLSTNSSKNRNYFNRIRIADSTGFKLPIQYLSIYPGTGSNDKPMSSLKIQYEFDLLSSTILNYKISSGTTNDASYLNVLSETIEKDDLCLRDLGYYKLSDLSGINEKEAYYVSRLKSYSVIYSKDYAISKDKRLVRCEQGEYRRLYIDQIFNSMNPGEIIDLEDVQVGNTEKLPCRLILTKLTDREKGVRLKKINNCIEKKSMKGSYSTDKFLDMSAFITNVPKQILNSLQIYEEYSLRWQIELMFKVWKSVFKIAKNKNVKIERFHCALYGKLISIVLSNILISRAKDIVDLSADHVLSEYKSFSIIKDRLMDIKKHIFIGVNSITRFFNNLVSVLKRTAMKSKKKGKKISSEIVENSKLSNLELTEKPA